MMAGLARRLGCTDGQAWTLALASVLAVVMVGLGLPPAFRGGDRSDAAAASEPVLAGPRLGPEDAAQVPTLVTLQNAPPPPAPRAVTMPSTSATTFLAPTTTTTATTRPPARVPLRVTESGWASARGGTPVASAEVPEGALPVGARAGMTDELSFVRLTGNATVLELSMLDDPLSGAALVLACPITDPAWEPVTNVALEDAPPHDCDGASEGARGIDGTWSFDLSQLPDRAGRAGFALVPAPGAPTFRIRYSPSPR